MGFNAGNPIIGCWIGFEHHHLFDAASIFMAILQLQSIPIHSSFSTHVYKATSSMLNIIIMRKSNQPSTYIWVWKTEEWETQSV
mgnify:CR=1 FL=1